MSKRRRVWHALKRSRKKVVLAIFFLLNISFILQLYANFRVYPQTKLGTLDVSGKTTDEINALVDSLTRTTYDVMLLNRRYTYSYPDMGVVLDKEHIRREIFARNRTVFPANIVFLIRSLFVPTAIAIPLAFTPQFSTFIDQTAVSDGTAADDISFDPTTKTLEYVENTETYRIDESFFVNLLAEHIGDTTSPLYPKLLKVKNEKAEAVADAGSRMKAVFLSPLTAMIDAGGTTKTFVLSEKELAELTKATLSADQLTVSIELNQQDAEGILNRKLRTLGLLTRGVVVTPKIKEELTQALNDRFAGHTVNTISLSFDSGPNTVGDKGKKYIEVDISQQKMYLFVSGKLIKTHRVSTGRYYPTPTGEFAILNKTGLGYSAIYRVWMPYWMGFAYSNELHAYFGIHELPYYYAGGTKIQRPREFIGSPNTGGCIALDIGAAKEVYRFADIGTPVVIYN